RGRLELGGDDLGQLVPLRALRRLREHHDRGEARGLGAHARAQPDLELAAIVVAAPHSQGRAAHSSPAITPGARSRSWPSWARAAPLKAAIQPRASTPPRGAQPASQPSIWLLPRYSQGKPVRNQPRNHSASTHREGNTNTAARGWRRAT